jgi:hypothetical protein
MGLTGFAVWILAIVGMQVSQRTETNQDLSSPTNAKLTYYQSYPMCCPKSPNYDPTYSKEECADYSGCEYIGDLASLGHKTIDYVKT